jgi:hypothetical protein
MEYIRKAYGVPAKRGGRITYHDNGTGKALLCTIVAARGHYLRVRKDGAHPRCILTLHPTWNIEYADA